MEKVSVAFVLKNVASTTRSSAPKYRRFEKITTSMISENSNCHVVPFVL
jgi:hypothetical protein